MTWEGRTFLRASSAPPDQTPVWVDITRWLGDWSLTTGRQSTLSRAEPARLSVTLLNADHRFTPGNITSPYFPWWIQGCRLQLQESIGSWSSEYPDFYLELPDVAIDLPGVDQSVTVNATDRLGRLQSARTFISTLGEHILYRGGDTLKSYWPSDEPGAVFRDIKGQSPPIKEIVGVSSSGILPESGTAAVVGQGSDPITGDDISLARLDGSLGTSGGVSIVANAPDMRVGFFTEPVAIGDAVTFLCWYYPQLAEDKSASFLLGLNAVAVTSMQVTTGAGGVLSVSASGTLSGVITGPVLPDQAWTPIALRYGFDPSVFELWVGTNRYTGSLSGSASSDTITGATVAIFYAGGFGHAQLYVGPTDDWTFADYLAQHQHALTGLERQSTGERVRTILGYAGVPAGEVDADDGIAVMQRARLAGKDPLTALREAEATEQGRLLCRGSSVVFQHRHHRYSDP